jgi:hypothetical protein
MPGLGCFPIPVCRDSGIVTGARQIAVKDSGPKKRTQTTLRIATEASPAEIEKALEKPSAVS